MTANFEVLQHDPGAAPGVEHEEIARLPSSPGQVHVTVWITVLVSRSSSEIDDLEDFVSHHRPEWVTVRWIDIDGLSDKGVVHTLATKYELHPLAVEDLLDLSDRPKVEPYGDEDTAIRARLFIVARAIEFADERLTQQTDLDVPGSQHRAHISGGARRHMGSRSTATARQGLAAAT